MDKLDIYSILMQKRKQLLECGDPLAVDFTLQEINVLSDLGQLRMLKVRTPFPADYKPAKNLLDCYSKLMEDNELYRILEFCMYKNRVLVPHITKVFTRMKRE